MSETETTICPQCWTETPNAYQQCQVCGRYLRTLEEQQEIMEKDLGRPLVTPMRAFDPEIPTKANPRPKRVRRAPPPPPPPPNHSKTFVGKLFRTDAENKDKGPKPTLHLIDQGIGPRLTAFVMDLFLIAIVAFVIPLWVGKVVGYQMTLVESAVAGAIFAWLYLTLMTISHYQATIGQCVLGLVAVDKKGEKIGIVRATVRFVALLVSMASLLGVLWIGLTKSRRGWHDLISGTRIVERCWMIENEKGQFVPYESKKRQWFSLLR